MTDIVNIGLSVDSRSVKEGTSSLDEFGNQAKKTESATDKLSATLKGTLVAATAMVVAALYKSVEMHREFQKSVSELAAITGAAGDDLKYYSDQAMRMGSATGFAAAEVVEAFKLVASAKPELLSSKEALAAVTSEVLTLARASSMELSEAANAVGGSLNQFGKGAEDAARFVNVLAAGAKFGASEVNETAQAMKNVGAVASSVGLSFEETNAAIQSLAAVSLKGAEAGTGLRGVLLKLSTQSRDEFNPEIVGLETALKNLGDANLSTAEKEKIFGAESLTAATALISQSNAIGKLTKDLTGTNTAMEQAAVNADNLDGDMKAMTSAWGAAALTLGEVLNPALRAGTDLLAWFGKAAQSMAIALGDIGSEAKATGGALVALITLDMDGAAAVIDARKAESELNMKKIDDIWAGVAAKKSESDIEIELAEQKKRIDEEEIARSAKRDEARRKSAELRAEEQAKEDEKLATKAAKVAEQQAQEQKLLDDKFAREAEQQAKEMKRALDSQDSLYRSLEERAQDAEATAEERETLKRDREMLALAEKFDYIKSTYGYTLEEEQKFQNAMLNIQKISDAQRAAQGKSAFIQDLSTLGKQNQAFLMLYKAAASIEILMAGGVRAEKSAAWAATWGGPIAAASAFAVSWAATLANVGMVTGLLGGGGVSAGSGVSGAASSGGGTPTYPFNPEPVQATESTKPVRELRVTVESDGPHSQGMREFAKHLAETIRDMGGTDNLVIS